MIVSWNWLQDYVSLDMDVAELEHRLSSSPPINLQFIYAIIIVSSNEGSDFNQPFQGREQHPVWKK